MSLLPKKYYLDSIFDDFFNNDVVPSEMKAEFKDGILKIVVPKEDKKIEKKQITIE